MQWRSRDSIFFNPANSGIGEYLYMARTGQEKSGRRGRGRPAAEERFPAAAASRLRDRRQSRFWIWVIFRHFLGFGLAVAWLAGRPGIPRSGSAPVQILPANPCFDSRQPARESLVATAGGLSAVLERTVGVSLTACGNQYQFGIELVGCPHRAGLVVLLCCVCPRLVFPRGFISGAAVSQTAHALYLCWCNSMPRWEPDP